MWPAAAPEPARDYYYKFKDKRYDDTVALHASMFRQQQLCAPSSQAETIPKKNLHDEYEYKSHLGDGGQTEGVALMVRKDNKQERAVKKLLIPHGEPGFLERMGELSRLMKTLEREGQHPNVGRIYEYFQDEQFVYSVGEPYSGGNLQEYVTKKFKLKRMDPVWLKQVLSKICKGIAFLHDKNIKHCDIKEPNIMCEEKWAGQQQAPGVLIIDFDLSQHVTDRTLHGGTPGYMPPEVWRAWNDDTGTKVAWTPAGDVFSLGVVFFNLYCHNVDVPVRHEGIRLLRDTFGTIEELNEVTECSEPDLSIIGDSSFRDLVGRMLHRSHLHRPDIKQVQNLVEAWGKQFGQPSLDLRFTRYGAENLMKHQERPKLYRALCRHLVTHLNFTDHWALKEEFQALDRDGNGIVEADELRNALKGKLGGKLTEANVEELVQNLMGANGKISYTDFMAERLAFKADHCEEMLQELFTEFDTDKDGSLDPAELQAMMNTKAVSDAFGERVDTGVLLQRLDQNGDGKLSWEEFICIYDLVLEDHFKLGDDVQYLSAPGCWIDTKINGVQKITGDTKITGVMIDARPGVWFGHTLAERQRLLRRKEIPVWKRPR